MTENRRITSVTSPDEYLNTALYDLIKSRQESTRICSMIVTLTDTVIVSVQARGLQSPVTTNFSYGAMGHSWYTL